MIVKDKVAIITGAARGIGEEYALRFALEGARVVVCDILDCGKVAEKIESKGGEVLALKTDVASEASTAEMAKKTAERFGRIDILVNNAAIYGGIAVKSFEQFTVDEWDKLMTVNLKGMWLCCKAVFPYMKKQAKGKIINIASTVAFDGTAGFIHYTVSKGGVISFTRAMAREVGEYNINVNAVAPGFTMTQSNVDMYPNLDEIYEQYLPSQCLKRREQPKDLAGAVIFLASDDSDFITGQTIVVDGGAIMH